MRKPIAPTTEQALLSRQISSNREALLSLMVDEENTIKANVRIYTMSALHLLLSGYPIHDGVDDSDNKKPHGLAIEIAELAGLNISQVGSSENGTLKRGLNNKVESPDEFLRKLIDSLGIHVPELEKNLQRWGILSRDREKYKNPLFVDCY